MEKSRKKSLKDIVLLVLFVVVYVSPVWAGGGEVWDELIKRANKFYQQAEEERAKGNLVMALTLLSKASFMFPEDERVKVKLDNLILRLRQKVEMGENCNEQVLEKRLEEAQQEVNSLKKQVMKEKELWQNYYQEKIEELKQAYEEKIKVLEEKHKFEMEKKEQMYKDILAEKQKEYKEKLNQIKKKVEQNLKEMQTELREQNKALADKDAKIKRLLESYSALEQKLKARYQDKMSSLQRQLSSVIAERKKLDLQVKELETRLKEKQDRIQSLLTKYESLSRDYRNLKQEIDAKISSKEKKYRECLSNLKSLQYKNQSMRNEVEALQVEKENISSRLALLKDTIKEQKEVLKALKEQLEEKDIIIRNLKDKIATLHSQQTGLHVEARDVQRAEAVTSFGKSNGIKESQYLEKHGSVSVEEIFDEAMKAIDAEDYKLAKKLLIEVLKKDPNNTVAKYMLESVNLILGD